MNLREVLKNRVLTVMPFPAFWSRLQHVTNEKKILEILLKQNLTGKIGRLSSKNCPN